ncbi:hypothetical protein D3C77_37860 [compost metagenome]
MREISTGYFITEDGRAYSSKSGKWLKGCLHKHGYKMYCLPKGNGKFGYVLAHRLVALAFIPNPNNHPLVCHRDDDPTNNHVSNLYWGTKSSNLKDAYKNGLKQMTDSQKIKMQEARWPK